MGVAVHAARMGWMRNLYKIIAGKTEMKNYLRDLGVVEKILLKLILNCV
jgi:hypothetical protein